MVSCPICRKPVKETDINRHIDSDCESFLDEPLLASTQTPAQGRTQSSTQASTQKPSKAASFFQTPAAKRSVSFKNHTQPESSPLPAGVSATSTTQTPRESKDGDASTQSIKVAASTKRDRDDEDSAEVKPNTAIFTSPQQDPPRKKAKTAHAPLAERMRPKTLDQVHGQSLVGPSGVLRNLILTDRVPSMILWGGPGTGKTTIARLIAQTAGTRFVEINSTSSGVAECKRLFQEAKNELGLTGRKTIVFCDEIHRFSKSQQDVFLGPVEAGTVTLIAATTENPSFKVVAALLSRCRTFTLAKLTEEDVFEIMKRALEIEAPNLFTPSPSPLSPTLSVALPDHTSSNTSLHPPSPTAPATSRHLLTDDSYAILHYLSAFADGDARTALNLLELALDLCYKPDTTIDDIKTALTQTLVYDRAGDQHYDTISAFHKSVRGSNPDAALYYLARMLQSGEDPLYVARRMVVIASEDVGLADNSMLSLATATYSAAEKIGMPECRINLGHCAVALCLAPKSTRAYRGLNAAYAALKEPGVAGLPVPVHLRNAPTKLMKEMGYGKEYKYNPDYVDGKVVQRYLPEKLEGREFLDRNDLGSLVDAEYVEAEEMMRREEEGEQEMLLGPDGD